jgi:hypothetical protein
LAKGQRRNGQALAVLGSHREIAYGDFTMPHRKPSKRKLASALGAGLSLSLAGGVSAARAAPTADVQTHEFTLYEEEISDISLGTFYVFDNEKVGTFRGLKVAQRISCKGGMGGYCAGGGCVVCAVSDYSGAAPFESNVNRPRYSKPARKRRAGK